MTSTGLAAGWYYLTVSDALGCMVEDSVVIDEPMPLVLSADSTDARCGGNKPGAIDLTVSGGTPFADGSYLYEWHDNTGIIATTQDIDNLEGEKFYWVYVTDSMGCIDSLRMFINEEKNIELTASVSPILCYGDSGTLYIEVKHGQKPYSYVWLNSLNDTIREVTLDGRMDSVTVLAGEYRVVVNDNKGCDEDASFLLEDPDELIASASPAPAETCEADTFLLNGNPAGGTGSYFHLWSGDGAAYLSSTDVSDPQFRDAPAGSYELVYTVTDSLGCVAEDMISVEVFPAYRDTTIMTACENELPFSWQSQLLAELLAVSGFYSDTLNTVAGCDSILTVDFEVLPVPRDTLVMTACENELPFNWQSQLLEVTGFYSDTLTTVAGCDSILTVDFEVLPLETDTDELTVCANELPYIWYGHEFSSDSILVDTIPSTGTGCDTILTLTFNVDPVHLYTAELTVCENELPYTWYGHEFSGDSILVETVASTTGGCDTVRTLMLDVIPNTIEFDEITVCANELPYTWYGHVFAGDSILFETVASTTGGCDILRTLSFSVDPLLTDTVFVAVCESDLPFIWYGNSYDISGTYTDTIPAATGCDTVATLNITITPTVYGTEEMVVCEGAPEFDWNGETVVTDRDSSYTVTLESAAACDSIATLNPTVYGTEEMTVCEGAPEFDWNGETVVTDRDSSYTVTLESAALCDSIATLNVTITPTVYGTEEMTVCEGVVCEGAPEFDWNGETVVTDRDSSYTVTLESAAACDSIATLNVTITPTVYGTEEICLRRRS